MVRRRPSHLYYYRSLEEGQPMDPRSNPDYDVYQIARKARLRARVQRAWRKKSGVFRLESSVARPTFLEVLGWANQEDCDDQKEGTRRKASHPGE